VQKLILVVNTSSKTKNKAFVVALALFVCFSLFILFVGFGLCLFVCFGFGCCFLTSK